MWLQVRQQIFPSFVAVVGFGIRDQGSGMDKYQDPGWTSRIRNTESEPDPDPYDSSLFELLDHHFLFLLNFQ
jgi:hypothetical protein